MEGRNKANENNEENANNKNVEEQGNNEDYINKTNHTNGYLYEIISKV